MNATASHLNSHGLKIEDYMSMGFTKVGLAREYIDNPMDKYRGWVLGH